MRLMSFILSLFIVYAGTGVSTVTAKDLPVSRVVLSTSGLAHFEHETTVEGSETLELAVRLDQVDDILKSMVVFDDKGSVGGITLPGRQPLSQIFRDLPFNRQALSSTVALLNAVQGAEVTIHGATKKTSGKLIKVTTENAQMPGSDMMVKYHRVSLLTAKGIKQAVMEDLNAIEFNDKKLRSQIDQALKAIREHSTQENRTLDIALNGKGKRGVALAYVVDAPLWKSAYRLVLPEKGKNDGFVQGWAVVENMTGGNWKDVEMALVSGNPVTYRQALYQSYHVSRPQLPVEVLGRVMPRVDKGAVASAEEVEYEAKERSMQKSYKRSRVGGFAAPSAMPMEAMADSAVMGSMVANAPPPPGRGAASMAQMAAAAQSEEATTQVLFKFPNKFSLGAGETMMLPFVSRNVPMERLSLYQPDTHATHPLASVRIKNDGSSGLPPGIVTLYEESKALGGTSFVGDAQLPVFGKGEERIVSYALDSKTKIDKKTKSTQRQGKITIAKGVMRIAMKYRSETTYTIKAPAEEGRVVLIEHPRRHDYKIIQPDPKSVEVTDKYYRIKVPVAAGKSEKLSVVLERDGWQTIQILNLSAKQLMGYAGSTGKLDPKSRKVFEKMAELRMAVDQIDARIRKLEQQRQTIYNDQKRLRENIRSLSGNSGLKNRYLERLNDQEDQLEEIEEELHDLNEEKTERMQALKNYIAGVRL